MHFRKLQTLIYKLTDDNLSIDENMLTLGLNIDFHKKNKLGILKKKLVKKKPNELKNGTFLKRIQ